MVELGLILSFTNTGHRKRVSLANDTFAFPNTLLESTVRNIPPIAIISCISRTPHSVRCVWVLHGILCDGVQGEVLKCVLCEILTTYRRSPHACSEELTTRFINDMLNCLWKLVDFQRRFYKFKKLKLLTENVENTNKIRFLIQLQMVTTSLSRRV